MGLTTQHTNTLAFPATYRRKGTMPASQQLVEAVKDNQVAVAVRAIIPKSIEPALPIPPTHGLDPD